MNDPVILIIVFLFGATLGSFLNVLIYRLPRDLSIVSPPSSCPQCQAKIAYYDNIPLISYLILLGKCRRCGHGIPFRYFMVELTAAVVSVISIWHFGISLQGFLAAFLLLSFIAIFFIDLEFQIIPNVFTIPGVLIGLAASFTGYAFVDWRQSLLGAAIGGLLFFLVGYFGQLAFKKEAMGFGDVKLAAMLGAFLGWKSVLLTLVIASFFGSIVGIALILIAGKKGRSSYVPFGPFLVVGATIALFWGEKIVKAYIDLVR
jgi:leader peptidase (prepilin peptidase)/N-methyltransferase